MNYDLLYDKLVHKKVTLPDRKGVVCGHSEFGLIIAITEGKGGWSLNMACCIEYIHPDYADNIFGFWEIDDTTINKLL